MKLSADEQAELAETRRTERLKREADHEFERMKHQLPRLLRQRGDLLSGLAADHIEWLRERVEDLESRNGEDLFDWER